MHKPFAQKTCFDLDIGKLYASSGTHGVYTYDNIVPGEMMVVDVYKPFMPFLYIETCCHRDHDSANFYVKILLNEKIGFLMSARNVIGHDGTLKTANFWEGGPSAETKVVERYFYEVTEDFLPCLEFGRGD
jgi:hypothetical protein